MDPEAALQAALPDAEIDMKRWGLKYFGKDWTRYQVVLDANIERGDEKTKCRGVSTETPVGAPLLDELQANDGAEFARQMEGLITGCLTQVKAEGSKAEGQSAEKTNQDAPNLSAEPIKCWDGTFQPQQDLCPPPPDAIARICPDGRGIGWPWECRSAKEIRIDDGKAACALQELKFDPGTNGCIP